MIQVSNPSNFSTNLDRIVERPRSTSPISYGNARRTELPEYSPTRPRDILPRSSTSISIKNDEGGSANLQIQAKVQFLDNKIRPAGFTEFFLVDRDLSEILSEEGIKPPAQQGILSHAEYWARSVQRGYQFPGVAAKIRNALAFEFEKNQNEFFGSWKCRCFSRWSVLHHRCIHAWSSWGSLVQTC